MFLLFSTKIVVIVSSKCPVFLKMTTMLRTSITALIHTSTCTIRTSITALIHTSTCTILVEITLALNPWCSGARVVHVHTPGTYPSQCKAIHDSLSLLPKLEESQETWSNILHMAIYCPTFRACSPLTQVPCVPKSLARALRNIRHLHEWSTGSECAAVRHSERKCCEKDFNKHTYRTNHY